MFGFEDSLKELKKEFKMAGADVAFLKEWQKPFDKVRKQSSFIEGQYIEAKKNLEIVRDTLEAMEKLLIMAKEERFQADVRRKIAEYAKEMKKHQMEFNQEFLIGKEDKDFHLTYKTILELCGKYSGGGKETLILQSEVENLLALTKEALTKEWPSFRALAYFYLENTDRQIFDLPHADKISKVEALYSEEFLRPMRQVLEANFGEEKANQILEVDVWNY